MMKEASYRLPAFGDELLKIAAESVRYKKIRVPGGELVQIRSDIPVIRRVPTDPEELRAAVKRALGRAKPNILGYANVAFGAETDLKRAGFKPTRAAVPLPGEGLGTTSWRSGKLHVHKLGPIYLAHEDIMAPEGVLKSVKHGLTEGVPAILRRKRGAPLVRD